MKIRQDKIWLDDILYIMYTKRKRYSIQKIYNDEWLYYLLMTMNNCQYSIEQLAIYNKIRTFQVADYIMLLFI